MDAKHISLLKFIEGYNKQFRIPLFQRNYSWNVKQCKELFDDICDLISGKRDIHYIGNIVFYIEKDGRIENYILIDGQQRITTILIFLCALRDLSVDSGFINAINQQYFYNLPGSPHKIRLKQTAYDETNFNLLIDKKTASCLGKIKENYNCFIENITDLKNKNITLTDDNILSALEKIFIVYLDLQPNAGDLTYIQTIFEKINSTGLELTKADLIRNFLLLEANSIDQSRNYNVWKQIEDKLDSDQINAFIKHYLVLKTENDIKSEEIYSMFKDFALNSKMTNYDILNDLKKYADIFYNIQIEKVDKRINNMLNLFKNLNFSPLYPLFMKIIDVAPVELEDIFRLLLDFLIRYRIVKPSGGGSAIDNIVKNIIKEINSSSAPLTKSWLHIKLSNLVGDSRYPNDKEFKSSLCLPNKLNWTYGVSVYSKIEESFGNPYTKVEDITIEHLMPQTITSIWQSDLGPNWLSIYNNYIHSIGNLTPLSKKLNSKISNGPWSNKKTELGKASFNITHEIPTKYPTWDENNIKDRNEYISDLACKLIEGPIPVSSSSLSGTYDLTSMPSHLSSLPYNPLGFSYKGKYIIISNWNEIIKNTCNFGYIEDPAKFKSIINTITNSRGDVQLTDDPAKIKNSKYNILGTPYYVNINLSADSIIKYSLDIARALGIDSYIEIEIG